MPIRRVAVAAVLLAGALTAPAHAGTLVLDKSLAGSGISRVPVGDRGNAGAGGVAVMPDGRIVTGGYAKQGDRTLGAVERLSDAGEPDKTLAPTTSFPGTALVDAAPDKPDEATLISDVALAPDGSIYVSGAVGVLDEAGGGLDRSTQAFVARLKPDGSLDPAFRGGGGAPGVVRLAGRDGKRVVLGPDGVVHVLAEYGQGLGPDGSYVHALTATGAPAPGYGSGGKATLGLMGTGSDERELVANDMALDGQGRIVVAGFAQTTSSSGSGVGVMVARFTAQGALDTSFGGEPAKRGDSRFNPAFPGVSLARADRSNPQSFDPETMDGVANGFEALTALTLAPDGGIVVVGRSSGAYAALGIVGRYTANGLLERGFGVFGGYTAFRAQAEPDRRGRNHDTRLDSVVLAGGRIIANGIVDTLGSEAALQANAPVPDLLVAALTPGGQLDPSSVNGGPAPGLLTTPIGGGRVPVVRRAVAVGDKVLIAGRATSRARFGGDFVPDRSPADLLLVRLTQDGPPVPPPGAPPAPPAPPQGPTAGCGRVVKVRSATLVGCFATKDGVSSAEGVVLMNGTTIDVANGSTLVADPAKGTIKTAAADGKAGRARLRAVVPGGALVALSDGPVSFTVPSGGASTRGRAAEAGGCKTGGRKIGTVSTAGVGNLLGFPMPGTAQVSTAEGMTFIEVNVELPKPAFVDAGGCATLVTTSAGGLKLDSLHVEVGTATLGPLELAKVVIDYTGKSDTWKGVLSVNLGLPGAVSLTGTITFVGGEFGGATIAADFPTAVPILPPSIGARRRERRLHDQADDDDQRGNPPRRGPDPAWGARRSTPTSKGRWPSRAHRTRSPSTSRGSCAW